MYFDEKRAIFESEARIWNANTARDPDNPDEYVDNTTRMLWSMFLRGLDIGMGYALVSKDGV